MNQKDLLKLAGIILLVYKPAEKGTNSYFITKQFVTDLLGNEYKSNEIKQALKFAQFQSCVKNVNGKSARGYWVMDQDAHPDLSALLSKKEPINHDKTIQRVYITGENREEQALKYITDNWYMISQFMPHDIVLAHSSDPTFKNASAYKKRRAIEHAGFVESYTLIEETRTIAKMPVPKNAERQTNVDLNKILGRY